MNCIKERRLCTPCGHMPTVSRPFFAFRLLGLRGGAGWGSLQMRVSQQPRGSPCLGGVSRAAGLLPHAQHTWRGGVATR